VAIIECDTGTTGRAIAAKMEELIAKLGLDVTKLKAVTTDGAGNMTGHLRGAAALLRENHPELTHIHCYSHVLNLAIMHTCQIQTVQNMMDTVRVIHSFFSQSPKRTDHLHGVIPSTQETGHKR
jgi:hypothetical protein